MVNNYNPIYINHFIDEIDVDWVSCIQERGVISDDDPETHCLSPKRLITEREARITLLLNLIHQGIAKPLQISDSEEFSLSEGENFRGFNITCFPPKWDSEIAFQCVGYYNKYDREHDHSPRLGPNYKLIDYTNGTFQEIFRKYLATTVIWNDNHLPLAQSFATYRNVTLLTPVDTVGVVIEPVFISVGCSLMFLILLGIGDCALTATSHTESVKKKSFLRTIRAVALAGAVILGVFGVNIGVSSIGKIFQLQWTKAGFLQQI